MSTDTYIPHQDTQWPRWEVLKQDTPSKPHQAVGSVHATDADHALVTARTVFVRRPSAVSMWVIPATAIHARTAEELEQHGLETAGAEGEQETYLVLRKTSHRRSMVFGDHIGEVTATSPQAALKLATETFTDQPALAWWVVPESAVVRTPEDDGTIESWFAPAKDKTYRQQSAYGTVGSHISRHKQRPARGACDTGADHG